MKWIEWFNKMGASVNQRKPSDSKPETPGSNPGAPAISRDGFCPNCGLSYPNDFDGNMAVECDCGHKFTVVGRYAISCAACGKELSKETNSEECPDSLYWHRKHTAIVLNRVCVE